MKYTIPISVIMPCYNCEDFISFAINSILDQSFKIFELIIINDGSTDGTEFEIKNFDDDRIKYRKISVNSGNYIARNIGIDMAKGKYICVMDADDISLPNRLELQFNYLESHPNVGCIGGCFETIDKENTFIQKIKRPLIYPKLKVWLLLENCVCHPTLMIRSHLIRKHNLYYNPEFIYSSDYDLIIRASELFSIRNLNEILIQYRIHDHQISNLKRIEQRSYANKIRNRQLRSFNFIPSKEEIMLYQKLINQEFIDDLDLEKCEELLNKLYEINYKIKKYNLKYLFGLFQQLLDIAVYNNSLGGWSIEKELVRFIKSILPLNKLILEFGSGKGTEALLASYFVTSIEHDPMYSYNRSDKHNCLFAPIERGWYQKEQVEKSIKGGPDLIIVDGPPDELRCGILKNIDLFKETSIPIIFDDMDREIDMDVMMSFCEKLDYSYKIIKGGRKSFAFCCKR